VTITETLRKKASDARAALLDNLIAAAEGKMIDPQVIIDLAQKADVSLSRVALVSEHIEERLSATKELQLRDFDAEHEKAIEDYRAAAAEEAAADAAITAARDHAKKVRDRCEALLQKRTTIKHQQAEAVKKFNDLMKATAGDGRDASDWRNVKL
jgi:hypothetical protein